MGRILSIAWDIRNILVVIQPAELLKGKGRSPEQTLLFWQRHHLKFPQQKKNMLQIHLSVVIWL